MKKRILAVAILTATTSALFVEAANAATNGRILGKA